MPQVTSKDGTTIAYDQTGSGPAVILITGALGVRYDQAMVDLLSEHFTVINYDRRGRGESSDTAPYAVQREIEDIEALIEVAGGASALYGISSGAVLALETANQLGSKVTKLAMYEPPLILTDSRPPVPSDYVEQLEAAIEAGRPGDAAEIFMTQALRLPQEYVDQMRHTPPQDVLGMKEDVTPPMWAEMEKVAHTLSYDGRVARDFMTGQPLPADRLSGVTIPTLLIVGGNSEPFFSEGGELVVAQLPDARLEILEGQDHAVSSSALAPMLIDFLKG